MRTFFTGKPAILAGALVVGLSVSVGAANAQYAPGTSVNNTGDQVNPTIGWAVGVPPGSELRNAPSVSHPLWTNAYRNNPVAVGEAPGKSGADAALAAEKTAVSTGTAPMAWQDDTMFRSDKWATGYNPALADDRDARSAELLKAQKAGAQTPAGAVQMMDSRDPRRLDTDQQMPADQNTAWGSDNSTGAPADMVSNRDPRRMNTAEEMRAQQNPSFLPPKTLPADSTHEYIPLTPNAPTPANPQGRAH